MREDSICKNQLSGEWRDTSMKEEQCDSQSISSRTKERKIEEDNHLLAFVINTVNVMSAGIGNRRRTHWLGCIGLVLWILNNAVHFSLDFYEAKFVFHVPWASTVALFLISLLLCSVNSIKHSIPWFIRGVKKIIKGREIP